MRRMMASLLGVCLLILSVSCTYHRVHFNLSDYTAEMPLSDSARWPLGFSRLRLP